MPKFWSGTIDFENGDSFSVSAKPHGRRGVAWLSWIPFRTGDSFTVEIEVQRLTGDTPVDRIHAQLMEPGKQEYVTMVEHNPSIPFKGDTVQRFLALTGEYVLRVDLVVGGIRLNRRLLSLHTYSQDASVANLAFGLIGVVAGVVLGVVLTVILG